MRIAVVGAGAVGGLAGGHLARAGHDVTLIDGWPEHVAAILMLQQRLGLVGGSLVVQPVAAADALPQDEFDKAFASALAAAERQAIVGKALTPYLLARVDEATGGRSRAANLALVLANARLAAEIARALHEMMQAQEATQAGRSRTRPGVGGRSPFY